MGINMNTNIFKSNITSEWITTKEFAKSLHTTVGNLTQILINYSRINPDFKPSDKVRERCGLGNKWSPEYVNLIIQERTKRGKYFDKERNRHIVTFSISVSQELANMPWLMKLVEEKINKLTNELELDMSNILYVDNLLK
jgi:hypothetical protein